MNDLSDDDLSLFRALAETALQEMETLMAQAAYGAPATNEADTPHPGWTEVPTYSEAPLWQADTPHVVEVK